MDLDKEGFKTEGTIHRKFLDLIVTKDEETGKELYKEKDMVSLCLLLGSGNTESKAELLYDEWDEDCNGVLTLEEFKIAIDQLLTCSVELINLAVGTGAFSISENERDVYTTTIRKHEEQAKADIIKMLYEDKTEISRNEFISILSNSSAK